MHNLLKSAETPWLMVGSDLCAGESSAEWRRGNLPGANARRHERIDKLFPQTDVAGSVLDVLASGVAAENVLIRMRGEGSERFLCASFRPYPSSEKPKSVLMEAWEMKPCLALDGETGEVLEGGEAEPEYAGDFARESSLAAGVSEALRAGSHYLGRFRRRRLDGREIELEAMLILDDREFN